MPWMLPLSLVSGVLMSACASTQMTAGSRLPPVRSRTPATVPEMLPIAMLWSPPSVSANRPAAACARTWPASARVTADTARALFMPRYGTAFAAGSGSTAA